MEGGTDVEAVLLFKNPSPLSPLLAPTCPFLLGLIRLSKLGCGPRLTYRPTSSSVLLSSLWDNLC